MVQLGQRPAAVAGGHVGDQVADVGAADVLGGAGLGDAQGLVAVGEACAAPGTRGGGGMNIVFRAARELRPWRGENAVQEAQDRLLALMEAA